MKTAGAAGCGKCRPHGNPLQSQRAPTVAWKPSAPTLPTASTAESLYKPLTRGWVPFTRSGWVLFTLSKRDIWAFGCVLFEMLTGRKTWDGRTVTDVIAGLVAREPEWNSLPPNLHPRLRLVLERCLEKEYKDRGHDIADVRVDIQRVLADPGGVLAQPSPDATHTSRSILLSVATLVVVSLTTALVVWNVRSPEPAAVTRLSLNLPTDQFLTGGVPGENTFYGLQRPSHRAIAFSPDGRYLVYVSSLGEGSQPYLRALDDEEARPIPNTEGGSDPFFSPNGEWIAFFVRTERQLKRVPTAAGQVQPILDEVPDDIAAWGASWADDDTILLSGAAGVYQVAAVGGVPEQLTHVNKDEDGHLFPQMLPGGNAMLFSVWKSGAIRDERKSDIVVESIETRERSLLISEGTVPRYVSTGHLVFVRRGTLLAVAFDVDRLTVLGDPLVVVDDVMQALEGDDNSFITGQAQFALSDSGSLAYVSGGIYPESERELNWLDRTGTLELLPLPPSGFFTSRISPDGRRLAYTAGRPSEQYIGCMTSNSTSQRAEPPAERAILLSGVQMAESSSSLPP